MRKITRTDVFYRDDLGGNSDNKGDDNKKQVKTTRTKKATKTTTTMKHGRPTTTSTSDDGDILGPILGGLLGGLRRQEILDSDTATTSHDPQQAMNTICPEPTVTPSFATATPTPTPTSTPSATVDIDGIATADGVKETEVKFVGIFFR